MKRLFLTISILFVLVSVCFAAEIIIKIGDSPNLNGYKDGDVINAFNDADIKKIHAQHIVHVRNMPRNADGLLESGCLLDLYQAKVCELKIERISETEAKVTNLWTGEVEIRNATPNEKGNYMDVPIFFQRRIEHPNSKVFGKKGLEYVYGGNEKTDLATMESIWDDIEAKTLLKRTDFVQFPWKDAELTQYLVLKVDDFDEQKKKEMNSPKIDIDGNIISKSKKRVNYKNIGLSQDVLNDIAKKPKKTDIRGLGNFPLSVVVDKP